MREHWSSADWRVIIGGKPPHWRLRFALLMGTAIAIAALTALLLPLP